jgi:hypothetical protein
MNVTLVVFDRKSFDLSAGLTAEIRQYIDENYVEKQSAEEYAIDNSSGQSPETNRPFSAFRDLQRRSARHSRSGSAPHPRRKPAGKDSTLPEERTDSLLMEDAAEYAGSPVDGLASPPQAEMPAMSEKAAHDRHFKKDLSPRPRRSLQDVMSQVGESFQECLLRLIDERGFTDAQVYKRANIDRKLFSKIRCNPDYIPRRKTIISLAVAMELNIDEMTDLLLKAGIALSPGSKFDLIIRYCVENQIYDSMTINAILFDYDQPLLGA